MENTADVIDINQATSVLIGALELKCKPGGLIKLEIVKALKLLGVNDPPTLSKAVGVLKPRKSQAIGEG